MRNSVPSATVRYIDQVFPEVQSSKTPVYYWQHSSKVQGLLAQIEAIPEYLITLTEQDYVDFSLAILEIKEAVVLWRTDKHHKLDRVIGKKPDINPITLLRSLLDKLVDDGVNPNSPELAFVNDLDFRTLLRVDISSTERALNNNEWKAATVLAGSVVEALLLDSIMSNTRIEDINAITERLISEGRLTKSPHKKKYEKWKFFELIEVAHGMGLIKLPTRDLCTATRHFRNLIHPGEALRKSMSCTRPTALAAFAALLKTIEDLT